MICKFLDILCSGEQVKTQMNQLTDFSAKV